MNFSEQYKSDMITDNLNLSEVSYSLKGFRGNNSAYLTLPVSLNGKYDVDFYCKVPQVGTEIEILDFRNGGGTGFINRTIDNVINKSNGLVYVDRILDGTLSDLNLHLIEVKGITLISTQAFVLAANNGASPSNAFISKLRIYNHFTGELIYEWLFDETSGTAVVENTGSTADGEIVNIYDGIFATVTSSTNFIDSYRYAAWRVSQFSRTDCVITHDDGYAEMLSIVAPVLHSNGMVANIGVVKHFVESLDEKYMTLSDLKTLKNYYGFGIVNHTEHHCNVADLAITDPEMAYNEINNNKVWLNENGFDGDYLIYAGSRSYSPKAAAIAKKAGIKIARRPSITGIQPVPPEKPLALIPIDCNGVYSDEGLAKSFNLIDKAIALKALVLLYFHNVQDDEAAQSVNCSNVVGISSYKAVINKIKAMNVQTYTMADWYKKISL